MGCGIIGVGEDCGSMIVFPSDSRSEFKREKKCEDKGQE